MKPNTQSGSAGHLLSIDPATGTATSLGNLGVSSLNALTCAIAIPRAGVVGVGAACRADAASPSSPMLNNGRRVVLASCGRIDEPAEPSPVA